MIDEPLPQDGRRRAVIEAVTPQVDGGRFPAKRVIGDTVFVEADVFADGHDEVVAILRHRQPSAPGQAAPGTGPHDAGPNDPERHDPERHDWSEVRMEPLGNDRWRAAFQVTHLGRHEYTVEGWADRWETWRHDLEKRVAAGQDVTVDLLIGAGLVDGAAGRAEGQDAEALATWSVRLRGDGTAEARSALAVDLDLHGLMRRHADRRDATVHPVLQLQVEPVLARFSAWYELFPRSASPEPGRHGTFRDVIARLPYVAGMGFDVLYLPPIHPIGTTFRKGPNNVTTASPGDPGVPWAIGAAAGGHLAIHPDLGTAEDLRALVQEAGRLGIAVALDLALQASPDHPAVQEHPSWFRQRPDGTVQYAENPPKKYQDIYPFDFGSDDWPGLWRHVRDIVRHWIAQGIRVFRVDNPHTKPFALWEWLIEGIRREDPDVIFLAEAFTRPKVMYRLGKLGFSQSYTYFTWRTTKQDIAEYFTELSRPPVSDFFGPNAWPNTPDILHETLQHGGRPMFQARLVLAATLSSSYGIYGPAFELQEHVPREPGMEEYLDSEKYQVRHWDLDNPDSLAPLITRLNAIRRAHPALQSNGSLAFHAMEDDFALAYSKRAEGTAGETGATGAPGGAAAEPDVILVVVSLDPVYPRRSPVHLDPATLGVDVDQPFELEDLLDGSVETWQGRRLEVSIDPAVCPARIFRVRPAADREPRAESGG